MEASGEPLMKGLWHRWKRLARTAGNFQARIFLTLFYFTFVAPFGLGSSRFSDPLAMNPRESPAWRNRERRGSTLSELRRQY